VCLLCNRTTTATSSRAASRARGGGDYNRRRFMVVLGSVGGMALVGCVGPGDTGFGLQLVPQEQVQAMGLETWERIRQEEAASGNQQYQRTANQITRRILAATDENPDDWEIVVFAGEEANAFALPGGKMGIYEGMFSIAENDDQLAAVIGHEIGHNQADHAAERVNTQVATQGVLQLVSVALQAGNVGYANMIAGALGAGAQFGVLLPYNRNQELEADEIGLRNMARAGYDPRGAVALWENMRQSPGPSPAQFLSTHPAPDARIRALEQLMPEALELYRAA
jgi:predicted Zn-dependent protease